MPDLTRLSLKYDGPIPEAELDAWRRRPWSLDKREDHARSNLAYTTGKAREWVNEARKARLRGNRMWAGRCMENAASCGAVIRSCHEELRRIARLRAHRMAAE